MTQRQEVLSGPVRLPPYPDLIHALTLLLQALRDAQDNSQPTWEYAVELRCLEDAGVSDSTLRSLMDKGMIEHGYELTASKAGRRRFHHDTSHVFRAKSCFVLAAKAVTQVGQFLLNAGSSGKANSPGDPAGDGQLFGIPVWRPQTGELWFENDLVKIVPAKAQNQRVVLNAGQKNGWRQPIPCPFVISGDKVDPDTLHNTLDRLNRGQIHRRLHFHRDGTGRGFGFVVIGALARAKSSQRVPAKRRGAAGPQLVRR